MRLLFYYQELSGRFFTSICHTGMRCKGSFTGLIRHSTTSPTYLKCINHFK